MKTFGFDIESFDKKIWHTNQEIQKCAPLVLILRLSFNFQVFENINTGIQFD